MKAPVKEVPLADLFKAASQKKRRKQKIAFAVLRGMSLIVASLLLLIVGYITVKGLPVLSISNTDSLGELLQRSFPDAHIVKALNTMWCGIMVNPRMLKGTHHTYICGNNTEAKQKTAGILQQFGWAENEIIDLGDITNARGTEGILPLWLRVYNATKNGAFNFGIVTA